MDNGITKRIRELITADPNITTADIKKELGYITRSIQTTFCYEYKKMYGKIRGGKTITRDRVVQYFNEHPSNTITEARRDLSIPSKRIVECIHSAENNGIIVPYNKNNKVKKFNSVCHKIEEYVIEHPLATSTECMKVFSVNRQTASNAITKMRHNGLIPERTEKQNNPPLPFFRVKEAIDWLRLGYSIKEVSQRTGISNSCIRNYRDNMADTDFTEEDIIAI